MSQLVINPHLDLQNQVFQEFAAEDGVEILNEQNARRHWKTLKNITRDFGRTIVDISSNSSLDLFKKYGWIEFRIFGDIQLNAFAYREDNCQYLEINFGTLYLIRDSFFTLFSIGDFLPQIGESEREISSINTFKENFEENQKTANYFRYLPKCKIRHKCADLMSTIAIQFIYRHELTHLISCHSDYHEEKYGIKRLFEIKPTQEDLNEAFDSRAMEIEADKSAMEYTIMYASKMAEIGEYELFKPYKPYLIWIYTIQILFKLINPNDSYYDDELDSHPNSFIRTYNIYELSIQEAIQQGLISDEKEAVKLFDDSLILQKELFEKIGFIPYAKSSFEENKRNLYKYRSRVLELHEKELKVFIENRKRWIEEEYDKLLNMKNAT